jgi:concanavalin A-like lectin/glucanase superfamily protein
VRRHAVLPTLVLLAGCRRGFVERGDALDIPRGYREIVLADRPLGYWRLGGQGIAAHDELGRDDGQYTGACTLGAEGAITGDTAVGFDGVSCRVVLGDVYSFTGVAAYSLEAWVLVMPGGPAYRNIVGAQTRDATNPIDGYALIVAPGGVTLERSIGGANFKTPVLAVADGVFAHVVATYDGAMSRVFVDGMLAGSIADDRPMPAYATNLEIGASVTGNNFIGTIDEVAIYDTALTPERITAHVDAR